MIYSKIVDKLLHSVKVLCISVVSIDSTIVMCPDDRLLGAKCLKYKTCGSVLSCLVWVDTTLVHSMSLGALLCLIDSKLLIKLFNKQT